MKKEENTAPREYSNVKVYSGLTDTEGAHDWPPADAVIRNLQYYNLVASTTTSDPGEVNLIYPKINIHLHF